MSGMRMLRAVLLVLALAAAVVVFVVGSRDGGTDWQVPALVLIGVLVLIIHSATATGRHPEPAPIPSPRSTIGSTGVTYEELHHHANPHHVADPSSAEQNGHGAGGVPVATTLHVGMTDIVVPASSFPDAGHGHGPVIRVSHDAPPPPLASVLQPVAPTEPPAPQPLASQPPPPSAGPPPPDPSTILSGPADPVLLDLRPETEDPMVMRLIAGEPPPPDSRADVTSPDVSTLGPDPASVDTDHDSWMPTSWIPGPTSTSAPDATDPGVAEPPPPSA